RFSMKGYQKFIFLMTASLLLSSFTAARAQNKFPKAETIELNEARIKVDFGSQLPSAYIPIEVMENSQKDAQGQTQFEERQKAFFDVTLRKLIRTPDTPTKVNLYYEVLVPREVCTREARDYYSYRPWMMGPFYPYGRFWGGPGWYDGFYWFG